MPLLSIRDLVEADFPSVAALSRSLGRTCNPGLWRGGECRLVISSAETGVVAWARAHYWDPQDPSAPSGFYLGGVEVAPKYQGLGLAHRLSRARLAWVAERVADSYSVVNSRNAASIALQRSLGFVEQARAARFGTVEFSGGEGILFRRELQSSDASAGSRTFTIEIKDQ